MAAGNIWFGVQIVHQKKLKIIFGGTETVFHLKSVDESIALCECTLGKIGILIFKIQGDAKR